MKILFSAGLVLVAVFAAAAQPATEKVSPKLPSVTKADGATLKNMFAPKGRPVLVNFWATFCDPCRDEFPDLVKIAVDYEGRVDVITVSLDDVSEIDREVPAFLAKMGATMPAFLLSTGDDDGFITSVSKQWSGGLPFTVIYDRSGSMTYQKLGKFKPEVVRQNLDRAIGEPLKSP